MDHPELVPLEGGFQDVPHVHRSKPQYNRYSSTVSRRQSCCKGPLRAVRLLLLICLVPLLFILTPVYLRYRVFSGQLYPVGMTDMRLIDNKISTTWCQRQVVKSNATFNAFLVSQKPELSRELVPVSMTRHLVLEDDMKEYWGFYLLQGSLVTVSTCVRWPGASLIMIKGHKHLHECAYIGDDSSEELEELLEARDKGLLQDNTLLEKIKKMLQDSPANDPDTMKRHEDSIRFHDPAREEEKANAVVSLYRKPSAYRDVTDHDPKELQRILDQLQRKKGVEKKRRRPENIVNVPELINRHRETNIDRDEGQWLTFNDLTDNKKQDYRSKETVIDKKPAPVNDKKETSGNKQTSTNGDALQKVDSMVKEEADDNGGTMTTQRIETTVQPETTESTSTAADLLTSEEIFDDVMKKLSVLGDKGKRVLNKLNDHLKAENVTMNTTQRPSNEELAEEKISVLKNILAEALDEYNRRDELKAHQHAATAEARAKRDLLIKTAFTENLNKDDAENDGAYEEDFEPDGFADEHKVLNETMPADMSNSEFWSSFSSSEEALLECDGLILNLPLTPHPACNKDRSDDDHSRASLPNAVTYRVPSNGYYFFVFNSENEIQPNFIRVRFDLQKTIYDLTQSKIMECKNMTEKCSLPLDFFSSEKVILELPLRDNDSLWNEEFVVLSECEPRTSIYLLCAIAVPLLIVIFAFQ